MNSDRIDKLVRIVEEERDAAHQELWECFCATGGDPDGDDWRVITQNPGMALEAVRELRREYNDVMDEAESLGRAVRSAQ